MDIMDRIVGTIFYLIINGRIFEATVIIMVLMTLFKMTMMLIESFFKSLLPKENPPKEEPKERVKVIYIIQNNAGNEVRIEETDENRSTEIFNPTQEVIREEFSAITEIPTPPKNNKPSSKNDKPYREMSVIEWIFSLITYTIYLIVKAFLIIIIVVMSLILAGIAIQLLAEYIKNPRGF